MAVRTIRDVPGAKEFLDLSARAGANIALVQGPGGNTSIKEDGVLWVKASGTQLADALSKDIFVPLRLHPLLDALQARDPRCETSTAFVLDDFNPQRLRPSIETTLHALIPQRVVVHVHCVETISWACLKDAEAQLGPRLEGLDWAFVPYQRPGLPLTLGLAERMPPVPSVVVLGNHGLVVAAETVAAAPTLLADVQQRLYRPPAKPVAANTAMLAAISEGTGYEPAADPAVHGLAIDPARASIATGGSLYPDHVIFLGPSALTLPPGEDLAKLIAAHERPMASVVLVPGAGVLLPRSCSPAARAMARCLADVAARIPAGAALNYLTQADEHGLLNWARRSTGKPLAKRAARFAGNAVPGGNSHDFGRLFQYCCCVGVMQISCTNAFCGTL